jgi:hypothetical protein
MAVSANVLRVSTTLRLGERVLVRCDDGLLVTEYVLFDATDIVLRATDPVTVRETGYITTAGEALERLARAGVTPALAEAAARAMPPDVVTTFGRTGALGPLAQHLGACELFDGAVYRASSQTYEGAWLDLRSLAESLGRSRVSNALQAVHLSAALQEVTPSTPLHLSTANATRDRRPGERTHRRVLIDGAAELPDALARLTSNPKRSAADGQRDRMIRDALLARVRERASADASPQLREHLARLEGALAATETRATGPLSDPKLWAIEQQLATGNAQGVADQLDALEHAHGSSAAVRYLRARAALVGGDAPPSSVAQTLSVIANEDRNFHEAELGAARAWLAAGEDAYARHFARRLAEDGTARDSERLFALEILEATSASSRSQAPPPVKTNDAAAPATVVESASDTTHDDGAPVTQASPSADPPAVAKSSPSSDPPAPPAVAKASPSSDPPAPAATLAEASLPAPPLPELTPIVLRPPPVPAEASSPPWRGDPTVAATLLSNAPRGASLPPVATLPPPAAAHGAPTRNAPPGASMPPVATMTPPVRVSQRPAAPEPFVTPPVRQDPELVETLPLPLGASEELLAVGNWPTTALQARTAMTRLARSLARDYRLWYGTTLRCNVLAVDAMQRHLAQRYAGATLEDAKVVSELQRHGALLSEILARRLGAEWVDIAPTEPGYWAMFVAPETRCWPIGRVYRFVSLSHRERDLVSYFLDVEARTRR